MNEMYGVFKKFATDNNHDLFAKLLNSAYTTEETKKTLKQLHDEFGHYASLMIHKDKCYVAFQHNPGGKNDDEYADNMGMTMAFFDLERALSDDFDYHKDVRLHRIGGIGSKFAGHTARSSMNSASMLMMGDILHTTVVFDNEEEKQWTVFASEFDTEKQEFVGEYKMMLKYKDKIMSFNDEAINYIYTQEGYQNAPHGIMILTSANWSEYKGEYYTTAKIDSRPANNGIIVKTKDFRTVEFVAVVKENNNGQCEVANYIHKGKMYIACRQPWTTPYLVFMRYDLETGEWTDAYKIEDGNSRPWIFEYHDEIYLFNTLEEPFKRRYANISKIRTETAAHNGRNAPINRIATLFECGDHHCYRVYNDKIYFTCTYNSRIKFGELKLKEFSPTKVNQKLLELFGDIE